MENKKLLNEFNKIALEGNIILNPKIDLRDCNFEKCKNKVFKIEYKDYAKTKIALCKKHYLECIN